MNRQAPAAGLLVANNGSAPDVAGELTGHPDRILFEAADQSYVTREAAAGL